VTDSLDDARENFIPRGRPQGRSHRYYYKPAVVGDRFSVAELKAMGQEYMRAYCSVPFPAKDIPYLIKAFQSKERRA
jgi:hypothetical protein